LRSSRSATTSPRKRLIRTTAAVSRMVTKMAERVLASVRTRRKLSNPLNATSSG
jgi:hypothetical protein